MVRRCSSGFGSSEDPTVAAGDAELMQALAWLSESGVFSQAVQMGEMVPDFAVPDCHGGTIDLQRLLDRGPLVLIFALCLESRDIRLALQQLQEALPRIDSAGAQVAVLSPAPPAHVHAAAEALQLTLPIGFDAGSHVAQLFGLTYEPPEPNDCWCRRIGVPAEAVLPGHPFVLPATYVINAEGIAEFAVLEADLRQRVRIADLLRVLFLLDDRR